MAASPRYTVHADRILASCTEMLLLFAWISDEQSDWPLSWHHNVEDAARVCATLNVVEQRDRAERALAAHANVMEF